MAAVFDNAGVRVFQGPALSAAALGTSPAVAGILEQLPADHYNCVVTSPPYWQLRSYLKAGDPLKQYELGSEPTPAEYVANQVAVFREVRRVLHPTGVLWINIGETMASDWSCQRRSVVGSGSCSAEVARPNRRAGGTRECEPVGIPWLLLAGLRADGWRHRDTIVWAKPSCMPQSVNGWRWEKHKIKVASAAQKKYGHRGQRDEAGIKHACSSDVPRQQAEWADCHGCPKCLPNGGYVLRKGQWRTTSSHEYLFMLVKSDRYFCDAQQVKVSAVGNASGNLAPKTGEDRGRPGCHVCSSVPWEGGATRNPRSVQTWGPEPCKFAHYAAFPSALPLFCIKASTSPKNCCPKCGTPWSPKVETEGDKRDEATGKTADAESAEVGAKRIWERTRALRANGGNHDNPIPPARLLGYRPSCKCDDPRGPIADPVPCRVLDPYAGTGTTLAAALQLGCEADGIELNPEYVGYAIERLSTILVPRGQAPAIEAGGPLYAVGGVR